MKNVPDGPFFNRQFCVGAPQNCYDRSRKITYAIFRRGRSKKRSDMEVKMTSNLLQSIGLGGLDIAYVLIGMLVMIIILLILILIQFSKLNKLQKKYAKFMKGKDAKSLEQEIEGLYDDNDYIKKEAEKNRKDIKDIQKRMEYCYQKLGVVKYDAFSQMGGQLSFCLALLNEKDDGFILNSVQSSEGCYTYTKEVKKGECAITLGEEEKKALDQAMGY